MYWAQLVTAGLFIGAVYALYGLGITMVYKATRVPNFAHGAIGTVGAFVFYKTWEGSQPKLQIKHLHFQIPFADSDAWWSHWDPVTPRLPLLASLVLAIAVSALLGMLIEKLFMRHLVGAPIIGNVVATIGLFILITGLAIDFFNQQSETVPPIISEKRYEVGGIPFFNSDILVAVIALGLAIGLGAFFRYTSLGIAIRATADSRETARLLGINANRVAQFSWAAGSAMATLSAVLIISRGNGNLDFTALTLLILPGFAAAMFGGFISLVGTFFGGLTLGVAEAVFVGIRWPDGFLREIFSSAGVPQFVSFMVVIIVLMTRPKFIFKGVRVDEDSGVGFGRASSGMQPEDFFRRGLDRRNALGLLLKDWKTGRWALGGMVAVAMLAIPIFTVSYWSTVLGAAVFYALIALSIVVLTGWTGQISLAALAFAGAGAYGSALLSTSLHLPFFIVMPLCGLIGIPLAVLIGVPALRLRGFFLALATLAFMVACESWLFTQPALTERNDVDPGPLRLDISQPRYYMSLFFAVLVFLAVKNLGKTRVARAFHAIRDSENTAISMGIDPVKYKLLAFALSGFIAGIAGGSFGYMNLKVVAGSFTFFLSLSFIAFTVIAGLGLQSGAALVPLLFVIIPVITARTTTGTNQALFILSGYLAVRATIDYPNGIAAFWSRLLRPFSNSERVAWTTDGSPGGPAPEAAAASADTDEPELFEQAAEELETAHA